jgi:hypothetical protein
MAKFKKSLIVKDLANIQSMQHLVEMENQSVIGDKDDKNIS